MESSANRESKARTYGIAAFVLAVANVALAAAFFAAISRQEKPLAFAENHLLAMTASGAVAVALVLTVVILVLATESSNTLWKTRGKASATTLVAFLVAALFAAAFVSFGSLSAIDHLTAEVTEEELPQLTRETFVSRWHNVSCGFVREVVEFVREVGQTRRRPEQGASTGQASDGRVKANLTASAQMTNHTDHACFWEGETS